MTTEAVNAFKSTLKAKTPIDLNAVALAMDMLSKIRKRPDGYSLEVVRAVRNAIHNDTEHPLKEHILNIIRHGSTEEQNENQKIISTNESRKEEIENRIKDYQKKMLQEEQQRKSFDDMRGRKPKSCDNEYREVVG